MVPADWRITQNWDGPPNCQLWVVRWATQGLAFSTALRSVWHLNTSPQKLSLKSESPASEPSVTCLFQLSHPPPAEKYECPLGHSDTWWPNITVSQVSPIQYLFACQNSQRSMSSNMVKSGLIWGRVFRRCHLGRRVTAVTRPRWPTVVIHMTELVHVLRIFFFRNGYFLSDTPVFRRAVLWYGVVRLFVGPPSGNASCVRKRQQLQSKL